ncbi:hypothetical protein IWZ00DRAFT_487071 [Phyllosticta capitalensis]
MSGRGANARKAVKKNIEKVEKKHDGDNSYRRPSSQAGWHIPAPKVKESRSGRDSVSLNSIHSRSGDEERSGTPTSAHRVEKKQSAHPRGRGAGVPLVVRTATSTSNRHKSSSLEPGTPGGNSILSNYGDDSGGSDLKMWLGNGQPLKPWQGFRYDRELQMKSGDCTFRFSDERIDTEHDHPDFRNPPLIRCHIDKLLEARSPVMVQYIKLGQKWVDDRSAPSIAESASHRSMDDESTKSHTDFSDFGGTRIGSRLDSSGSLSMGSNYRRGGYLSDDDPRAATPLSRTQSDLNSTSDTINVSEPGVTCDAWVSVPQDLKTSSEVFAFKVGFRNFIALLYNKPIVGSNLFDMLKELFKVSRKFHAMNTKGSLLPHPAGVIIDYLVGKRLDDVRGNLSNALSLLAWCEYVDKDSGEDAGVYWEQGYTESFIHAVGMMTSSTSESPEFKRLSTVTKHNLSKAFSVMQIRILDAETKFASFDFAEFLEPNGAIANSPGFRSVGSFGSFLKRQLEQRHSRWPPKKNQYGHWFTRDLVEELHRDLGAIYDILVNRDVIWNDCEERAGRRWQMTSKSKGVPLPDPELPGLPTHDVLISFDNQHGYQHIPYPFPLIPAYTAPEKTHKKKNLFGVLSKKEKSAPTSDEAETMKEALAFTEATNVSTIGMRLQANELRDRFLEYEKTCGPTLVDVPARDARLGRWVLLYGLLQILSTLSVDTLGMRYTDNVPYFLCPPLNNVPPWPKEQSVQNFKTYTQEKPMKPACQELSHCWIAPQEWDPSLKMPSSEDRSPAAEDEQTVFISELDGRDVTDSEYRARLARIHARINLHNHTQAEQQRALQQPQLDEEEYRALQAEHQHKKNVLAQDERRQQAYEEGKRQFYGVTAAGSPYNSADVDARTADVDARIASMIDSPQMRRPKTGREMTRLINETTRAWNNAIPSTTITAAPTSPQFQPLDHHHGPLPRTQFQYSPPLSPPPASPPPAAPVPSLPAKSPLRQNSSRRTSPLPPPQLDGAADVDVPVPDDKGSLGARYHHLGFEEDDEETLPKYFAQ